MSVHAGTILTVAGRTVIDRIQEQGLGDVRIPIDTIREVGNELVVDKVPQEPDFTFTLQGLNVSTELEALLHGKVAASNASAASPGVTDPDGTTYKWSECQFVNILSPWKDHATGASGVVAAGHIVPGFYATRVRYRFGVTDNAQQEAELGGGAFYYGKFAPVEDFFSGTGAQTAFVSTQVAVRYRKGGAGGTTFKAAFGVLVDGVPQIEGTDYDVSGGGPASGPSVTTVTFKAGHVPKNGAQVRFAYFTTVAQSYPQATHASTVVLPGAVRGRNIRVSVAPAGASARANFTRLPMVQSFELEGTVDTTVEREFDNEEPVGRNINGVDTSGTAVIRSKDYAAFFALLKQFTGVDTDEEVVGFLNLNPVQVICEILNPKNPGQVLKTLYSEDAIFEIPGTPARVNQPTDFNIRWEAQSGDHSAIKGAIP